MAPHSTSETRAIDCPHQLLAEASFLLASSLDEQTVLDQACRLVVPALADWCTIQLLENDQSLRPAAIAHADPAQVPMVQALLSEYPDAIDLPGLVPGTLRTRQPQVVMDVSDADLEQRARDERQLSLLRSLGLRAELSVPLVASECLLGALSLHSTTPGRFSDANRFLAEQLGRHLALALLNARRYRAALESRDEAARLGRVLDEASDEIYLIDSQTLRIQQANGTALASIGYTMEELRRRTFLDLSAELTAPALAEQLAPLHSGERETVTFETILRRKDDSRYPVDVRLRLSQSEQPPVLVALVSNASERKAAQRRIAVQNHATRILAQMVSVEEAAPEVLRIMTEHLEWDFGAWWMHDTKQDQLACLATWHPGHPRLEELAEASRTARYARNTGIVGRIWAQGRPLWFEEAIQSLDEPRGRAIARAGIRTAVAFPILIRGSVLGVIELLARHRHAEDAALLRLVGSLGIQIGQLVERQGVQEALRESNQRYRALAVENARLLRESQEAVRSRDEFLAVVSHDLKNPLVTIKGRAQLVQRRIMREMPDLDPKILEDLASIDATASRMTDQINELLDVARIQTERRLDLDRQQVDLIALLRRLAAEQQQTTEQHRIQLHFEVSELIGWWDPIRLERVVGNLLSNAIKYSPEGGEITVQARLDRDDSGEYAVFSVADRGIGIPAADLPLIFERFRRAANVGGISGTGVGLAGVRQIVEQHGGSIAVESEEGRGTTFTVRLPLGPPPNERRAT